MATKPCISKEQLAEWAQREVAYYVEAEKWKQLEEKMKREQEEKVTEWKRKDAQIIALDKYKEKYSQEEIDEAIRQIRIDRLKDILKPYNQINLSSYSNFSI